MEWFVNLINGVISSLIAELLKYFARFLSNIEPMRYSVHIRELNSRLREMPFIYKDLETDLLSDFVEVDLAYLIPDPQSPQDPPSFHLDHRDRLRRRRHAVFLGQAGAGKTTLFRHTALEIGRRRGTSPFFFPNERLLPFYVPLKAIDNAGPYPILRYLLSSNTILKSPSGRARLAQLATRRQLFLMLDGYDEMPFPGDAAHERNYLLEELRSLLCLPNPGAEVRHETPAETRERRQATPSPSARGTRQDALRRSRDASTPPEIRSLYDSLRTARLWLSSRREFFERNPIADDLTIPNYGAFEVRGISENRVALVGRVFDKYKQRSKTYHDLLSAELFVALIDSTGTPEVRTLSASPLFLTVMCYIYANKALELGTHQLSLDRTAISLTKECVKLLLEDLDAYKVRGLSAPERAAILRRRNAYTLEKREYLTYLAAHVLLEHKQLFDLQFLRSHARTFFSDESTSPLGARGESR